MNRAERRANWITSHRLARAGSQISPKDTLPIIPSAVRVRIGELVLHGFPPSRRQEIAEATQQQLTSLLTTQGLPAQFNVNVNQSHDVIDGGSFRLAADARPLTIGSLVAGAVYGENR